MISYSNLKARIRPAGRACVSHGHVDAAVILKEGLDLAAQREVGTENLVRELLTRRGRSVVGAQPLLDLAPLICGGPARGGASEGAEARASPG